MALSHLATMRKITWLPCVTIYHIIYHDNPMTIRRLAINKVLHNSNFDSLGLSLIGIQSNCGKPSGASRKTETWSNGRRVGAW